jgi:hypothetical protein
MWGSVVFECGARIGPVATRSSVRVGAASRRCASKQAKTKKTKIQKYISFICVIRRKP